MATQEKLLPQPDLEDYQNFGSQTTRPATAEELVMADTIINRAWKLAQESPPCSPEQLWSEFDAVRTRITASDSESL
jgi:hypothetical protein